ncbi:aspartate aminotransferase family protein [Candidatus Poribacteria bacterium]|nr:aspartate aminotransferase family protein [Candidatus Poribacteria bacterium]
MSNASIKAEATQFIVNTYGERSLALVRGEGPYVWDADGNRYLDFLGGIAVNGLGHCHPAVVAAITEQARTLIHCSNLYYIEPQVRLAKLLVENSFAEQCFFCNSGAEANEAAIKLARKYAKDSGKSGKFEIVTMNQSFHGRTLAAITATAQPKYHKGFEPLPSGFRYVPFDDLDAAKAAMASSVCAVLVEPIQSEGGVNVASPGYLEGLRKLCDANGALLIFDEVQTSMGRLGTLWGYESFGVVPDVLTMAKSLGGGTPIGALLSRRDIAASFGPGTHASTFGGNPLVTAAAHAALTTVLNENLPAHAAKVGAYLSERMAALRGEFPCIVGTRGRGLLQGLVVNVDAKPIAAKCIEEGLLTISTNDSVLRFLPPLTIQREHVDEAVAIVRRALKASQ